MPQATDLVIKNGAATPVDKTFTLIAPAAGDGGLAQWALKEGTISSVFPTVTSEAHRTANKSRKATFKFRMPSSYTDSVTGLTMVNSAAEFNATSSVPDNFPEAMKADYVAFATNLFQQTLIKALVKDAVSAT